MRCAIYARVSSDDQNNDMQLRDLREYSARMGWTATEYLEKESSVKRRPVYDRMLADARLRKFDVVIAWKLDRLFRSMKQFVDTVLELDLAGVSFRCITQHVSSDQRDPMGKFVLGLFALLAELERGIILERVNAGVKEYRRAFEEGRIGKERHSRSGKDLPIGRPRRVFDRKKAVDLHRRGMSVRQIAAKLKVGLGTVHRALSAARGSLSSGS